MSNNTTYNVIDIVTVVRRTVLSSYRLVGCRMLLSILTLMAFMGVKAGNRPELHGDTIVSLVTFYPGSEIFELEGHSALRVQMPDRDLAVTWGMFNFNAPNFVYRFVKGETDYSVALVPWTMFVGEYLDDNRRIVQQTLNLDGAQTKRLLELVDENLRAENRVYRYNYVKDNCATRPLRIIELAVGDSLYMPAPDVVAAEENSLTSYRDFMRYYHENYPWYQFGIDLALGSGIDYDLDVREMTFAPVLLCNQVADAHIGSPDGPPLVVGTSVLNDVSESNAVLGPTPWLFRPLVVFWVLALAIGAYIYRSVYKRHSYPRIIASIFFAVFGLTGLLLTFLIFVSVHEATSPNWNYLWINPIAFIPVVFVWFPRMTRILTWYFMFNVAACALMLGLWASGVQSPNAAFIPLLLLSVSLSASYLVLNPPNIRYLSR